MQPTDLTSIVTDDGAAHSRCDLDCQHRARHRCQLIHRYFNHNDLYHIIQMGTLYCLYRAGALLRDKDLEAPDVEAT